MANKRIIKVLILLSVMFLSLIGYLTYIELFEKDELVSNPYNQRQWGDESSTVRGSIYDIDGVTLAETTDGVRVYPYKGMYAHIIGYNSRTYGRTNIERTYNSFLMGKNSLSSIIGGTAAEYGYDINLTIDHSVQREAYNALGSNNGAVVAIDPKTGAVIAMASKPDYDPNDDELIKNWTNLTDDPDAPFVARASSGLYAPGSTFKMLTALSAIENGYDDETFEDNGSVEIGSSVFENQNNKAYGSIDMSKGLAVSSNVVFCTLGSQLGGEKLRSVAEDFGFNKTFEFDIPYNKSIFPEGVTDKEKSAALGIGQGDMLATPLEMAMVSCGIANNGKIMKPYLVDSVTDKGGKLIKSTRPSKLYDCGYAWNMQKITDMMVMAVKEGTASNASIWGIDVAGKTGTAENEKTDDNKNMEHTWFIGFAPADDPQIAVAVMMEYSGGSGGGNCAPIAARIMRKYLNK